MWSPFGSGENPSAFSTTIAAPSRSRRGDIRAPWKRPGRNIPLTFVPYSATGSGGGAHGYGFAGRHHAHEGWRVAAAGCDLHAEIESRYAEVVGHDPAWRRT